MLYSLFSRASQLILLLALATTSASRGALVTDGFDDGNRINSPNGINWYAINTVATPGLAVAVDSGIGAGNALTVMPGGTFAEAAGIFGQTVALGPNIGDSVKLSFSFRLLSVPTTSQSFRFGIYKDSDGQLGTGGWGTGDGSFDNESPGTVGDTGYYLLIPLLANGDGARINDEANASGNAVLGGTGDTDFVASPTAGTFPGIADTLAHTITFNVVRTGLGANNLLPTLRLDSSSFGIMDQTNTIFSAQSFDYFVATTTSDTNWVLDNFRIESFAAIPEPSSFLFGFVALFIASRIRKR